MLKILQMLRLAMILGLALFFVQCGGSGTIDSAGNEVPEDEDGEAGVQLSTVFVRQGVTSSYVETENFRATVYVGKQVYQDSESTTNSSFSPQMNAMTHYEN